MSVTTSTMAPNQTIVHEADKRSFFSYDTLIATDDYEAGTTTLTNDWNYSKTTTKYLARYLGIDGAGATAEIRRRIADGRYTVK